MLLNPLLFLRKKSHPLNVIYISKDKLISNYQALSKVNPKIQIAPVLKSNAYGHGIVEVGKIMDSRFRGNDRVPFICVDSLYEAYQLKKASVKSQILIMGYIDPESLKSRKLNFSYAVWDLKLAQAINKYQNGAKIHIFVDTGMNREGVKLDDLRQFLSQIKALSGLKVEGLMSHLACSDEAKNPMNKLQLENFKKAKKIVLESGFNPQWFHLGGSYGLLNDMTDGCNTYRMGKALYGVVSQARAGGLSSEFRIQNSELKPVLKLTTKIVQIKKLKKQEKVGYSSTYEAKKEMVIGVLPLGYNDGVDRRLSNKGAVLVDGVLCQILGLVSMNLIVVDLSNVKESFLGQEVVVFSDEPKDKNSIENSAKICGMSVYEFLVHLHPSTKRVIV